MKRIGVHSGQVGRVSWKRHFLCIMRNFVYSWLSDMRILVGRVLHRKCTESAIFRVFLVFFLPGIYGKQKVTL